MLNRYQEALNNVKRVYVESEHYDEEYFRLLQELVDKATPKKPIERLFESKKHFKICSSCWEKGIKTFVYGNYCDECGQRLE